MQKLDVQFYSFFVTVLSGMALGLLFDTLRALRAFFRPQAVAGAGADLLFWVAATLALTGGLFYGNWGELRLYVGIGILTGNLLYFWLASPLVLALLRGVIGLVVAIVTWTARILWWPVAFLAGLVVATARTLWRWATALAEGLWRVLSTLALWLIRPLNGPYRCVRLRYLLLKRRLRRFFGRPRR